MFDEAVPFLRAVRRERMRGRRPHGFQLGVFDDTKRWTRRSGIERWTLENRGLPGRVILRQRRLQDWRPFEHQTLGRAYHPVYKRAVEDLAAGAYQVPSKPRQP